MAWTPGTLGGLVLTTTEFPVIPTALSGTLKVEMYDKERTGSLLLHCCLEMFLNSLIL